MSDAFYGTQVWLRLRVAALLRDGYTCTVPGCRAKATHVDHIVSRRSGGGYDTLDNLRNLSAMHDAQIKEDSSGKRKSKKPLDPDHWWNHEYKSNAKA